MYNLIMFCFSTPILSFSAQHSSQSPVSLTSDASSPRPYVSPRNGTPQSNQKSLMTVHPSSITSSQTRVSSDMETKKNHLWRMQRALFSFFFPVSYGCDILSFCFSATCCIIFFPLIFSPAVFSSLQGSISSGKQGSVPLPQSAEKRPEDPRTLQQRRYFKFKITSTQFVICWFVVNKIHTNNIHDLLQFQGQFTKPCSGSK